MSQKIETKVITMTKKYMSALCAELDIVVPEGTTKKQYEALIDEYYKKAAAVATDFGVCFRQTDKPTAVYNVEFTISGCHSVRAESEAAARKWVEDQICNNYNPGRYEDADITDWEILDVNRDEEA